MNALIGFSGFVGSTLMAQKAFEKHYRSSNISEIEGQKFDLVVCAGAPAQKWMANKNPKEDWKNIENLICHLGKIKCDRFILISTVDVFHNPVEVDETTAIQEEGLHSYGLHRWRLEKFVKKQFSRHLIIRLPGLVGPGLRKNVLFDFLNNNNLNLVDSRSVFQFYPMDKFWDDISHVLESNINLIHFTAEPISVSEIAEKGFEIMFNQELSNKAFARYDMQTIHAALFGSETRYQYSFDDSILAIKAYADSEPVGIHSKNEDSS